MFNGSHFEPGRPSQRRATTGFRTPSRECVRRKVPDVLTDIVFENREVALGEIGDGISALVHHPDVDRHQDDARAERTAGLLYAGS